MVEQKYPARDWFLKVDRETVDSFRRLLAAWTTNSLSPRELDWSEFKRELARFSAFAEERHAAKHAAMLEAVYAMSGDQ